MTAEKAKAPFPSGPVEPTGAKRVNAKAEDEQEYLETESGQHWVCITDGVRRRWERR